MLSLIRSLHIALASSKATRVVHNRERVSYMLMNTLHPFPKMSRFFFFFFFFFSFGLVTAHSADVKECAGLAAGLTRAYLQHLRLFLSHSSARQPI
jgi:hypothetical protein